MATPFSSSVYPSFVTFHDLSADVCYLADGGLLNKWNGVTNTLSLDITNTPNTSLLALYNLRLFGAGDSANPQRLYYSALNNGDTLGIVASSGGYADVRTFGQEEITGLMTLGGSLLVFHRNGISRFTGISQDDINIDSGTEGVSPSIGTTAPHTLVAVENVGYFLSDKGIYEVTETGVNLISQNLDTIIRALDQTKFNRACAGHTKLSNEVWFYLPDVGVYSWNYVLRCWSGPMTGIMSTSRPYALWETYDDTTGEPILLGGHADGYIRQHDIENVYIDDLVYDGSGGTAFTYKVGFRRFVFGDAYADKAPRFIYASLIFSEAARPSIGWITSTDGGSQQVVTSDQPAWDETTWGGKTWGDTENLVHRIHAGGRGKFLDVYVTDEGTGPVIVTQVEAEAQLMSRRF